MRKILIVVLSVKIVGLTCLALLAYYTSWKVAALQVLATCLLGLAVIAYVRLRFKHRVVPKLCRGEPPSELLLDGVILLVAAVLLLLPGLVSDALGMLLLIPPARWGVAILLKRRQRANMCDGAFQEIFWCNLYGTAILTGENSGAFPTQSVRQQGVSR
jgi:UPF0716 protein FxsA